MRWAASALLGVIAALMALGVAHAEAPGSARGIFGDAQEQYTLTVLFAGDGHGKLAFAGDGDGEDAVDGCDDGGKPCQRTFLQGEQVTITATPDEDSEFDGFGGECSDKRGDVCILNMTAPLTLTAHFGLKLYAVEIAKSGEGRGAIMVEEPEGACASRAPCVFTATHGSRLVVRATAFPSSGSRFAGWSGDCSGSKPHCSLVITRTTALTGSFAVVLWSLAVSTSGEGRVTSVPAGIVCGSGGADACAAPFAHGIQVQLVAAPAAGYRLSVWSGFCSGRGSCVVPMTQSRVVQATFEDESFVDPEPEYRSFLPAIYY